MVIYPRGTARDGNAGNNSLKWRSKYGSAVLTAFNMAADDGINEKGLAAHLLYLDKTEYEKRDGRPGVANIMWLQYFLDNFATVNEVIKSLNTFQLVSVKAKNREWPLHLAIEDVTGDSAIIEYINGKMVVHHGPEYKVMTNEPAYDIQLENLKKYRLFGGTLPMPGDIEPLSRFVRASSYLKTLPAPKDAIEAAAYILGVIRTTAVPYGAQDTSGAESEDTWPTLWITVTDMTNGVYYFSSTKSPNIFWVELKNLDFSEKAQVLTLNPNDVTLAGEVSGKFQPVRK
jgi:choloylglycine hydrolase